MLLNSDNFLAGLLYQWALVPTERDVRRIAEMTADCTLIVDNCCLGVYLHDPRCICKEAKTKTRRKNKEDVVLDSLFWPVMPQSTVNERLDSSGQPHVIQPYNVPPPQNDVYQAHDRAVFSMWMHFVDSCMANQETKVGPNGVPACFMAPDVPINRYTNMRRLPVFVALSRGENEQSLPSQLTQVNHHQSLGQAPRQRCLTPMISPIAGPMQSPQAAWQTPLPASADSSQFSGAYSGRLLLSDTHHQYVSEDESEDLHPYGFMPQRTLFPEEHMRCSRGNPSPVTVTASFLHSPSITGASSAGDFPAIKLPSTGVNDFPAVNVSAFPSEDGSTSEMRRPVPKGVMDGESMGNNWSVFGASMGGDETMHFA